MRKTKIKTTQKDLTYKVYIVYNQQDHYPQNPPVKNTTS